MSYTDPADQAVDDAAVAAFTEAYGERAAALPPVAIVIAAYNEEGAIGPVVETLPERVCGLATTAIVVADGCADGTAKEATTAGAMVCDVPVNRGQGSALRLGYRLAREGGATYIVTTDADGQYNPAEMDRVLAPVVAGEADFVTGSRRLGSQETKDIIRRTGVRFFASSISLLTGQKISDTTFGLRAMRAELTGAVRLEQPQYQAAELLIGVITHGYKVAEVPATIHRRRVGESKKGQNPLYGLHLPGVNNFFYGMRFARVVYGTWWRERKRAGGARRATGSAPPTAPGRATEARGAKEASGPRGAKEVSGPRGANGSRGASGTESAGQSESAGPPVSGAACIGPVDLLNGSGPGSAEASASSTAAGSSADPAKRT
jgi:Glycosyl transferase family 2